MNTVFTIIQVALLWGVVGYLLPLLVLFFNYKKENNKTILEVINNKFTYKKKNKTIEFSFSDIEKVVLNLSFPLYHRDIRLFFWDEYYYAEIKLKNGKSIIITCLLCDEIETLIPKNLIERRRRIFQVITKPDSKVVRNFSKQYDS
ncbi:hypothetical protein [Aquimarina aquimarini]|uniref:hypothetical protein n=1 Tax=Aquimarina aquimarini TaxID=1191734 RepID=UPI00131EE2E5|nr:hypothetical protein [Aquimarina aquimarini]